jgi:hypothetical protein
VVSVADFAKPQPGSYAAELDEQARRKGVRPIASVDELRADVFESDQELEEFLADLEEFRHEHMA